jgi:hypothetical protein
MTDSLRPPSSIELREMLQEMVEKDLLGPAGGPDEIIDERTVRGRYILGMLAPRGQSASLDDQDSLALDGETDDQDGKPAASIPQATSMLPSSIGITFSLALDSPPFQITARWGQYQRTLFEPAKNVTEGTSKDDEGESDEETQGNEEEEQSKSIGRARTVWRCIPIEGVSDPISLKQGALGPWFPDPENREVYVRGLVRKRRNAWTITLFLVNAQTEPETKKDAAWIFQLELIVRQQDSLPIFVKRRLSPELGENNGEDRLMNMLYRKQLEFAVGHGVGVSVKLADGDWERAVEVRTRVIPAYEVERMGGSMRHVFQILNAYLNSERYDGDRIIDYIIRLGNSSPAKRLGFLLDMMREEKKDLLEKLAPLVSKGYVLLDPTMPSKGSYVSDWNVRVNDVID